MARNNSAFSGVGFVGATDICQGWLSVRRYQSAGDTQNGYHPQTSIRAGVEQVRGLASYPKRNGADIRLRYAGGNNRRGNQLLLLCPQTV